MTYYAIYDLQTSQYLTTGYNETDLGDLAAALLAYYSPDYEDTGDPDDAADWARMHQMEAGSLAEMGEFRIDRQDTPFFDVELEPEDLL